MKKIIPILSLCGALVSSFLALVALGLLIFCAVDPSSIAVVVLTIPLLIAATVATGLSTFVNFMFLRDRLCLIGFIAGLVGLLVTVAGYIVILSL